MGAVAFGDPAEAAVGAARIHLTLSDDLAVDEVLERALPGFAPNVVIVDHSTTSPTGTAARAMRLARKDARLMMEEAQRAQVPFPELPAIAQWMDRFIAQGHGNDDWVVIAKDALPVPVGHRK